MAAELRWILLALSLPLLAGIWWWTARRTRQAPGDAALREITPAPETRHTDPDDEDMRPEPEPRDWGVSPFEPLNIHTADFDRVPVLDGPMMVNAGQSAPSAMLPHAAMPAAGITPAPASGSAMGFRGRTVPTVMPTAITPPAVGTAAAGMPATGTPAADMPAATSSVDRSDRFAAAAPAPSAAELQRIVTIRVCAVGEARWSGSQLMAALEAHGLAFGRYQVFHRKHTDGRTLFCVASLIEPGTFDMPGMEEQEFRGMTLFAVLPGPVAPIDTVDELYATARELAEELSGMVQDSKGMPLSPQRAAALREDIARFQAMLPGN